MAKKWLQKALYPLEAVLAYSAYGLFRVLPIDWAAGLGAALLKAIGPLTKPHKLAARNLERALPELSSTERKRILEDMWDNLGRSLGEFPHLSTLQRDFEKRIEVTGAERLRKVTEDGGPLLFVAAHLANWEIMGVVAAQLGLPLDLIYRAPNNPLVAPLFDRRKPHPDTRLFPKGRAGAKMVLAAIKEKRFIGVMMDQRASDGIEARFFGLPAQTNAAMAQMALRSNCLVVPIRVERLKGSTFRLDILEPIPHPTAGTQSENAAALTQSVNDLIESWVRERPAQWLWVHRRWPKE